MFCAYPRVSDWSDLNVVVEHPLNLSCISGFVQNSLQCNANIHGASSTLLSYSCMNVQIQENLLVYHWRQHNYFESTESCAAKARSRVNTMEVCYMLLSNKAKKKKIRKTSFAGKKYYHDG
jgi:hypothetical protein